VARNFARAPRRESPGLPSDTLALARALLADPRFLALHPGEQLPLLAAAILFADAEGRFWPKVRTWAAAVGKSPATVSRAVRRGEQVGLLERTPYARPDGLQGSTTYSFAVELTRCLSAASPCASAQGADSTSSLAADAPCRETGFDPGDKVNQNDPGTGCVTPDPPERRNDNYGNDGRRDVKAGAKPCAREPAREPESTERFIAALRRAAPEPDWPKPDWPEPALPGEEGVLADCEALVVAGWATWVEPAAPRDDEGSEAT